MKPGSVQDPMTGTGLEEESEKELEEPGLLLVELPWEPEKGPEPEMLKILKPEGKPELALGLVLLRKD